MFNLARVSLESFRFAEPLYLWLLIVPAVLFAVWIWRFVRRRGDLKRLRARRALPVRERLGAVGDLAFWAAVLLAASLCIVALARPQALVSTVRKASADVVVLLFVTMTIAGARMGEILRRCTSPTSDPIGGAGRCSSFERSRRRLAGKAIA